MSFVGKESPAYNLHCILTSLKTQFMVESSRLKGKVEQGASILQVLKKVVFYLCPV